MEVLTLINAIANVVITISISAFMVFVFGRLSLMHKLPAYEKHTIKIGLALVAAGSLFNCLTLSTPPISEIILNFGLAVVFLWAAIFHYNHFVKKK